MNILFVCSQGVIRSRTAEVLATFGGIDARSCGTDDDAIVTVRNGMLLWADHIVCMERFHADYVRLFCGAEGIPISWLNIPDEFMPFDDELVALLIGALRNKIPAVSEAIERGRSHRDAILAASCPTPSSST